MRSIPVLVSLLLCGFMVNAKAAYVYDKSEKGSAVLREDSTLAENFGDIISSLKVEEEMNAVPVHGETRARNQCSTHCFCGTPNVNRIVGGTQVRQNKYPWTAQLVKGRYYPRLFCGGSLINDRYVLTAAHCVHGSRDIISIRLLQLDRSSNDPGITRKVIRKIVHPSYDPNRIVNDIALLQLEYPVPFTSSVRPVCLPTYDPRFEGKDGIVAGWGLLHEGGRTSNYLQEATVPIITNQECRNTRYKNKIVDVMLCAGLVKQGGKDACQGDSGGPLIVNEGRFKLAGVVSFGYGCAQPNAPGVYTRVSKFVDWIEANTRDSCYCSG